jgi:hypothetical protein
MGVRKTALSLEEAKTLLGALQCEYVAAKAAEITERARRCDLARISPARKVLRYNSIFGSA